MTSFQEPAKLLKDSLPLLPIGRALDVAMGKGRNAIFLASHGFEVTGLEKDEDSIIICKDGADKAGVHIDARCVDLENIESLIKQKQELLGKEMFFSGSVRTNKVFNNPEFIIDAVEEVNLDELIQQLEK